MSGSRKGQQQRVDEAGSKRMKDSKTDISSKESDDQRNTSSGGGDDEEEGADGNVDYDEDDDDAQFDLISSKGNLVEFLNDPVADRNENKDTMTPDSQLSFMEFVVI